MHLSLELRTQEGLQEKGLRRSTQACRLHYHRTGLKEMVKITVLILPLTRTALFEKIRGENSFSKYPQRTGINPNASVQAADTFCNRLKTV